LENRLRELSRAKLEAQGKVRYLDTNPSIRGVDGLGEARAALRKEVELIQGWAPARRVGDNLC